VFASRMQVLHRTGLRSDYRDSPINASAVLREGIYTGGIYIGGTYIECLRKVLGCAHAAVDVLSRLPPSRSRAIRVRGAL